MRGTLTTLQDLVAFHGVVFDFGLDATQQAVQNTFDAHNRVMEDMLEPMVDVTDDEMRRFGEAANEDYMDQADEFASAMPRMYVGGTNVGFPLRNYNVALQWTRKYFLNTMTADFAVQVNNILISDARTVQRDIKRAIFGAVNYNFYDRNTAKISQAALPVKALVNADGTGMPAGPNGEVFNGSTHTHYFANATPGDSEVQTLIETVIEHYNEGQAFLYINRAQEAFIRARTGFAAYPDPRLQVAYTQTYADNLRLDPIHLYNRAIGVLNGAEVWVKPWIPASYLFSWLKGPSKPLVMRRRKGGSGKLEIVVEYTDYPLHASAYEREFGMGVWERTNGAVLYVGGNTYTAPVL